MAGLYGMPTPRQSLPPAPRMPQIEFKEEAWHETLSREIQDRMLKSCTTDPRLAEGMYYAYLEEGNLE